MLDVLAQRRSLWIAFVATVLLALTFPQLEAHYDISLVDALSDPTQVRAVIEDMTPEQRRAHVWTTATVDVAYPLAYGSLFVGSVLAFFGRLGRFLAPVLLVVVPVDLVEGVVQILALTNTYDFVDGKAVLTPLKFALAFTGLALTVLGWLVWSVRWLRR
ncbi:MAG: hypothetical protein AAF648_13325 [Pseudomonadota bacterium]